MTLFGTFLIERQVVSATQVVQALEIQNGRRETFARTAVRVGVLDTHQVLTVLDQARLSGEPFEDAAVALGVATPDDVRRIAAEREKTGPRIGEILVEIGALTGPQLDLELREYERDAVRFVSSSRARSRVPQGALPRRWAAR